ncbi:formylmethanofuran dehydrogenase subunit C [Methanococcus maripaludis]|uniref:Tungsten-containing formylmethanofuran dehydrogenase 2 subunit C n=1 Tax=Methanococcus maripaludis TaxID=39152 RepID=A0A7J9P3B6_METMI|nr:tungsten-dependent formylmethanofuran dehydrogenase subunit FwdC [Methanococcus maripaludis]MBA2839969.1 formylmethanofuran dehydrogenase subunit C [Methanococcus maripaludis]MBA2852546.1 formylmethanofuran dehydrogenase subunit C [Methanococcus maripaludis]MBA2868324.1 formylmethanofuran dehydrogenase subunit C [Methanococcus maripaludis]
MNELILNLKGDVSVPVEMDKILPEKIQEMSLEEISGIELIQGNKTAKVGEIFDVELKESPIAKLTINNCCKKVKRIGEKMTSGEIVVNGDAGMYIGVEMKGGKITVNGDAESWVGQNLKGGEITINGNAENYVGSAYRGDWRGMSGGKITITGNAGSELGEYLKGGTIVIKGNTKIMPGIHQNGGMIIIEGDIEGRAGGEMMKGAIVVYGKILEPLPSFKFEGIVEDPLVKLSKKDAGTQLKGTFIKFSGDYVNTKPKGELYAAIENNKNLI